MEVTHEVVLDWIKSGHAFVKNRCLTKDTLVVFCVDLFVYRYPKVAGAVASFRYPDDLVIWSSCADGHPSPWGLGRLSQPNIQSVKNVVGTLSMTDAQLAEFEEQRKAKQHTPMKRTREVYKGDQVKRDLVRAISNDTTLTSGVVRLTRSMPIWSADVLTFLEKLSHSKPTQFAGFNIEVVHEIVIPRAFWDCLQANKDWPLFEKEESESLSQPMTNDEFDVLLHRLRRTSTPILVPADRLWATIDDHLPRKHCIVVARATDSPKSNKSALTRCIASLKDTINWLTVNENTLADDDEKYDAVYKFIKDGYIPFADKLGLSVDSSDDEAHLDGDDFHRL